MNSNQAAGLVAGSHSGLEPTYFKLWMPYVFVRLPHPKRAHVLLPLNRNYKPLGTLDREWVEYGDFADSHALVFSRNPENFDNIWSNQRNGHFWLYDDGPNSRLDYFKRLERLMLKFPIMLNERMV